MHTFYGYTRVSTARQGEQGVSLQEQRDAIVRYAERQNLAISRWFEERETAAKQGRPVFAQMLKLLREGKARGVVIHKIDRSARNLRDWSALGELIDAGVDVRFAHESLDLHSRGGRLTADIQAVVSADFIRNLREETRKGLYGRFKQGLFPLPAPLGYLDQGPGKPKVPDPVRAPLVRKAFELYATGRYTLKSLLIELRQIGLTNRDGGKLTLNGLSTMLNNPFYVGLIRVKRTGETFAGIHEPLLTKSLFERVQRILTGRTSHRTCQHGFVFRRLFACAGCGYSLIGERQKGHVYYRCHTESCPTTGAREEAIEASLHATLGPLDLSADEKAYVQGLVSELRQGWVREQEAATTALTLQVTQLQDRLTRLTDAYLDRVIERQVFDQRKAGLLMEQKDLEERLGALTRSGHSLPNRLADFLELAGSASSLYETALSEERRDLLAAITSNRRLKGKKIVLELRQPFRLIAERHDLLKGVPHRDEPRMVRGIANGVPYQDEPRTLDSMVHNVMDWLNQNPAPPWLALLKRDDDDSEQKIKRKKWKLAA